MDCAPRQCEKRFLNALIHLCRGLHELDAQLVGELSSLILCDRPLVCPVRLVANEDLVDTLRCVLLDILVPGADV